MLNSIINSSLNNRFFVLMATLLVAGVGAYSALHLPIDAVPDLTNVQVQVITEAPALSPLEVDSLLSFPVSGAMSGLPDVEQIRSVSKFGVSVVTIVFKEGTDIYRARQLVGERLPRAAEAIPIGYGNPMLGPIATALGEVFQFEVKATKESGLSPMDLRTLLDWFIAYQLRGVEGVTEINAHGGEMKTYQVEVDPDKLADYRLSMTELFSALRSNNANVGGGYLVREGEARYIRGVSQVRTIDDIAAIVIDERDGVPVTVRDVAKVYPAPMIRAGLATRDGQGEIVTGLVMMLIGQNGREVVSRVKAEIEALKKSLPPGVTIEPLYDRTHLINTTLNTVLHNLTAGGILVIVVLLALLGNLRGGLIVALAIPLSMLFAANVMLATGISASLMSLGAIDFGLIVDSSVIMIENCVRRLAHEGGTRPKLDIIRDAAIEVRKPTMFGELIIAIVYLPILALAGNGREAVSADGPDRDLRAGRFAALVADRDAGAGRDGPELPAPGKGGLAAPLDQARSTSRRSMLLSAIPWRRWSWRWHSSGPACRSPCNLGGEFMPRLNEGDLLIEAVRIPSASLEGAVAASTQVENLLEDDPRGPPGLLQDGPPRNRQRRDGRAPDRRLDHAQTSGRVAPGIDSRRLDRRDGQALVRARSRHEVRFQPADRDEGQRAGRRGQERRGRADLRAGPQGAAPAVAGDRAGAGQDSGSTRHQEPDGGPAADAPDQGPPRPVGPIRDQGIRRARRGGRAGRNDGRHRFRGRQAAPAARPAPRVVAERPRQDRLDPGRRSPGTPDPSQRPRRNRRRGRAQRGRA